MKKWRNILALALVAVMLLGLVACGRAPAEDKTPESTNGAEVKATEPVGEEKDPILLEWYFRGCGQQEDTDAVEARVNELLKTVPGMEHVSVNFNCFVSSEYSQQVLLAQGSGMQIDILNTVGLSSLAEHVEDGSFVAMDDYISDELKAELPEWLWGMGTIDGKIYMVPNYQNAFNSAYILFPKEYMDKYGDYDAMYETLTNWNLTLTEKAQCLEDYVLAVRAGEGNTKYASSLSISEVGGTLGYAFETPYDALGKGFMIKDGSNEVSFLYSNPEFKEKWEIYAKWYDMGILSPDGVSTDLQNYAYGHMMDEVSAVFCVKEQIGTPEHVAEIYTESYGFEVVAIPVQQYDYIQYKWAAGGNGISSTCEHPEEAAKFIELLTTGTEVGKEIYNTVVFGLEGEHYVKDANDPDRIETLEYSGSQGSESTTYAAMKWIIGNSFYAYKNQAVLDGQFELAKEMNEAETTVSSSLIGFAPSTANISTQISQVAAVYGEYVKTLTSGVMGVNGWEATYNEFMQKLQDAGVQDVIDEYQRQLDEWLANK